MDTVAPFNQATLWKRFYKTVPINSPHYSFFSVIKISATHPALTSAQANSGRIGLNKLSMVWHTYVKVPPPVSVSCSPASECGSDRGDHRDRSPSCHHLFHASGGHTFLLEEQEQIRRGGDSQWDQVWLWFVFFFFSCCRMRRSSWKTKQKQPRPVNWF